MKLNVNNINTLQRFESVTQNTSKCFFIITKRTILLSIEKKNYMYGSKVVAVIFFYLSLIFIVHT